MGQPEIEFYGLSTCMWCKKTKAYLDGKGVKYNCIFVNELTGEEREKIMDLVAKLNPDLSFPTVKIGDKVIVGYNVDKIEEALKVAQ